MARVTRKKVLVVEPEISPEEVKATGQKISKPSPTVSVMGFLLFLAIGAAGYFYYQYNHTPQVAEAKEIKALVDKIGKVVALPQGETPTLATVTNKEKLGDQPFFQKAANGDKILIYADASQAILYRPGTEKIIDMTTVNIEKEQPVVEPLPFEAQAEAEVPNAPVEEAVTVAEPAVEEGAVTDIVATVVLYNGSSKVGVTNTFEAQLTNDYPALTVSAKEKAAKNDYAGVLVVDLSGTKQALAQGLAETYSGTIGSLPAGEVAPSADILVIIGAQ
jgi:hypothetical protein